MGVCCIPWSPYVDSIQWVHHFGSCVPVALNSGGVRNANETQHDDVDDDDNDDLLCAKNPCDALLLVCCGVVKTHVF